MRSLYLIHLSGQEEWLAPAASLRYFSNLLNSLILFSGAP
jgi:hypothetical protein